MSVVEKENYKLFTKLLFLKAFNHINISALSTNGHKCAGKCSNDWNNYETEAPRCKVASGDKEYCTTCQGEKCPNPPK